MLIQAGGSPRGIRASARFADHVFGADMPLPLQVEHRRALDAALVAEGRDPATVGILWQTPIIVAPTAREALAHCDRQPRRLHAGPRRLDAGRSRCRRRSAGPGTAAAGRVRTDYTGKTLRESSAEA